jgi:hypothetical protein
MALKSETVVVDGATYIVNELRMRDARGIMNILTDDPMRGQDLLLAASVTIDGKAMTEEDVGDLGLSVYQRLIKPVMHVNGMGADEGNGQS